MSDVGVQFSRPVYQLRVHFTQFKHAETREGTGYGVAWGQVVEKFLQDRFLFGEDKSRIPLLVPAAFKKGAVGKEEKDVEYATMGMLDFDGLTLTEFEEVIDRLRAENLDALVYSTWGQAKAAEEDKVKFRVLVPFKDKVDKKMWPLFWPLFNGLLGGKADGQCKDITRGYFLPSAPIGTQEDVLILEHLEGEALDTESLLETANALPTHELLELTATESNESIDRDDVIRFAKRMARSPNDYKAKMGSLLKKVLNGEPFAEKGQRDNTLYRLAGDLGQEFSNVDPMSLAGLFTQSLSQMGGDCPDERDVRDKVLRAQRKAQAEKLEQKRTQLAQDRKILSSGGPYTKEKIEAFCKKTGNGATADLFSKRLIVQTGSNRFHVFFQDNYITCPERMVPLLCRDYLIPVRDLYNVNVMNVSDKGKDVLKSAGQLAAEYGVGTTKEKLVLYAQSSYYCEATKTMIVAPCPLRDIQPKQHPEVDAWAEAACPTPELAEALRDWMSVVPDLSRALAMLALIGKTGIGKTSFAEGVAKLWPVDGATGMEQAFEPFNAAIAECPLLLADEALPTNFRGKVPTDKLRALISSSKHAINAKNQPLVSVSGHFRLIAAVNNQDKLRFGQVHGKEDVEAIQKRILSIDVREQAAPLFDYKNFVENDWIAEHILWLHKTRKVSDARFGVEYESTETLSLIRSKETEHVLEWVLWNLEARRYEADNTGEESPALVLKGRVFLNTELLATRWFDSSTAKKKEELPPCNREIGLLLKKIGTGHKTKVFTPHGRARIYHEVRWDIVEEHMAELEYEPTTYRLNLCLFTDTTHMKVTKQYSPTEEDQKFAEEAKQVMDDLWEGKDVPDDRAAELWGFFRETVLDPPKLAE